MNQTQPNQTSHLILLTQTVALSSSQYGAAQSVQWLGYTLGDLGIKSWQKQENSLFSKTSRPAPMHTQPPTQWKPQLFSGSKVARADSLTTIIYLEPSLQISEAIPPLNLSPSVANSGTTLFYPHLLPMYISQEVTFFLTSQRNHLIHYFPLQAHCMTHLFHLHWSNYINIMNSSNNKTHYIIFCPLINSLYRSDILLVTFLQHNN
jgi:hypothetical protein